MNARILTIAVALFILCCVIDLVRRRKMTFKYSIMWFGACACILFFSVYDQALYQLSKWAGFQLPSNFVFLLLLLLFSFLSLFLTLYINEQNSRTESLAQTLALLEQRVKKLEKTNQSNET